MVVDDTNRPQFDTSPWPWVVNKTYPTPSDDQCSAVKAEEVRGVKEIAWVCAVPRFLVLSYVVAT